MFGSELRWVPEFGPLERAAIYIGAPPFGCDRGDGRPPPPHPSTASRRIRSDLPRNRPDTPFGAGIGAGTR
jgi:hypothetical protein